MTKEMLDSQQASIYAEAHHMDQLTIRFQFFGIPIVIHPSTFLILLILGGGIGMDDASSFVYTLLFIIAGLLCLLTHELGHALTAKYGYGASTSVLLAWSGGLTHAVPPPPTKSQAIAMTIAGPLGTLVPGVIAVLMLGVHLGGDFSAAWRILAYASLPFTDAGLVDGHLSMESAEALAAMSGRVLQFYTLLCSVGVFWAVFNILPIFPLDGGQVLMSVTGSPRICGLAGIVTCLVVGSALSIYTASAFNAMIFILLAWYNYRLMKIGM